MKEWFLYCKFKLEQVDVAETALEFSGAIRHRPGSN